VPWEPDYVTVAQLKSYLRIPLEDTTDDAELARNVTAASSSVNDWAHRQFGQTDEVETRSYGGTYDRSLRLWVYQVDDLPSLDDVVVMADGVEVTGYTLWPRNALLRGRPYEQIRSTVGCDIDVTAPVFGWPEVGPAPVQNATLLQASRLAARRDSPFGIAGSPTEGSEVRLSTKLDVDAQRLLGNKFRREVWAG
jgi:hypothetical protein